MNVTYDTYPNTMLDYDKCIENPNYDNECRIFTVPKAWAENWIHKNFNESIDVFDNEFTYDDSYQMYEQALHDGVLIEEHIVSYGI